ncbi:MAG TPA: EamA family transporter [Hanamia sp.]
MFAILWASAATATKIGLEEAQPLVLAQIRFAIGGAIMLLFAHVIGRQRLPTGKEWKYITIYGLLNITIYLGCYVTAMQHVTAGIGALAIATNPLFISFLSIFFLKKKLNTNIFIALFLGTTGVLYASWPLLKEARITTSGLVLLLFSMVSYSVGAIYFSAKKWNHLNLLTINGWQTFIGGILLLPFTLIEYKGKINHFNFTFWGATLWLAIPVSIFAVQLWLWLLKTNTVKAGLWLFLCPVFGFAIAAWLLNDQISSYTIIGVALVMRFFFTFGELA